MCAVLHFEPEVTNHARLECRSVGGDNTGVWHSLDPDLLQHELEVALETLRCSAPDAGVTVLMTSPEDYVVSKVNQAAKGEGASGVTLHGASGVYQVQQSAEARTVSSLSAASEMLQTFVNSGSIRGFGLSSSSLVGQVTKQGANSNRRSFQLDAAPILGCLLPFAGFTTLVHPLNPVRCGTYQALSEALQQSSKAVCSTKKWCSNLDDLMPGRVGLLASSPLQDQQLGDLLLGWPAAAPGNSNAEVQGEFEAAWQRMMDHIAPLLRSDAADELEAGKWIQGFLTQAIRKPVDAFQHHPEARGMSRAWTHWQEHLMSTSTNLTEAFEELDETTAQLLQQVFMASTRRVLNIAGDKCQSLLSQELHTDEALAALNALLDSTDGDMVPVAGAVVDVQPHTSGLAQFAFQAPGHAPVQGTGPDDFALGAEWTAARAWAHAPDSM